MKKIECKDVTTTIADYKSAKKALRNGGVKVSEQHAKALNALKQLFTIAEAWNKFDNFIPDFSDREQYKYFPWFAYNDNAAGFVYVHSHNTASNATAYVGSRLCFSTYERAEQFGKQFIELWNDFLLFR